MIKRKLIPFLFLFHFSALLGCKQDDEKPNPDLIQDVQGAREIILHLEYQYGVGGYVIPVYRPYLLFDDGSVYKNLDTSIDKLDIQQSKQQEPEQWGTWKKEGENLIVSWHGEEVKTWEKDMIFDTQKASAGEQIKGEYRSVSGGGNIAFGGDVLTFSTQTIAFDGDKFTYASTSGGSSNSVTAYASEDKAGTYDLNGYTITLTFNNGIVEKKFFYFYPDSKDVFGIGNSYYVSRK